MTNNSLSGNTAGPAGCRQFTLTNGSGMRVAISEHGAALCSWHAPDRYGRMADVLVAGPDCLAPAGAAVHWHGRQAGGGVALLRTVPGGAADLWLNYCLDDDGSLVVERDIVARLPGLLARESPPCFNLNGGNGGVGDHLLQIDADYFVELDADGRPAGVATVDGRPCDFRQPAPIGARLCWPDARIRSSGRFDHCYVLRNGAGGEASALREVARVVDPGSGRRLQMYSTAATLQFLTGKQAGPDWRRDGFCLEAHASPEWPRLATAVGARYRQVTVYRLSVQD